MYLQVLFKYLWPVSVTADTGKDANEIPIKRQFLPEAAPTKKNSGKVDVAYQPRFASTLEKCQQMSAFKIPNIDFRPMILIVGQTFVNLSPGQVWKAPHNVIDAGTVDDQTDNVVYPNPSFLHNRTAPADMGHVD
jgi:hypothetical protein